MSFRSLCLSQKVPSNPRHLWTQLSSVDSTSVDTDYEQYEPSTHPSVPLSTFRSELHSFTSICIYFFMSSVSQSLLLTVSLCILRLKLPLPCACSQCLQINAVCNECLQGMDCDWKKKCLVCIILNADSQRYRTDVNSLMAPSGLNSLREEGESLFEERWYKDKDFALNRSQTLTVILSLDWTACLLMMKVLIIQWGYAWVLDVSKITPCLQYVCTLFTVI